MADQVEVERLIVRLLGDGSQFQRMLQTAQTSAMQSAKAIQAAATNIEGYQRSIDKFASTAVGALGAYGILNFLKGAREAYETAELASMKLNNAIQQNGGNVQALTKDYRSFADEVVKVTTLSKAEVLQAIQRAEQMGITGDAAKAVVKNMAALGASALHVRGSWMTMSAAIQLAQGNLHQAAHMLGVPREMMRNEASLLAEVQRRLANGWNQAMLQGQTNDATMKRLQNTFLELKKEIGKVLSEQITPWIGQLTKLAEWFKHLDDSTKGLIVRFGVLASALLTVRPIMFFLQPIYNLAAGFLRLSAVVAITTVQLTALAAVKAVSTAGWLAWTAVMAVAKTTMLVFTGLALAAKAAMWLLNAALSVTNVLLLGAGIVAAAGTFLGIAAAAGAVVGVIQGMTSALGNVGEAFANVFSSSGAADTFVGIFGTWKRYLSDIVGIARYSLPEAFKLIGPIVTLVVEQIKAVFIPLWDFIATGFRILWQEVAKAFKENVITPVKEFLGKFTKFGPLFSPGLTLAMKLFEDTTVAAEDAVTKMGVSIKEKILDAFKDLKFDPLTDGIKKAKTTLEWELLKPAGKAILDSLFGPYLHAFDNKAFNVGSGIGKSMMHGFHSVKIQAVLYESAEALARFTEFKETLMELNKTPVPGAPTPTGPFGAGPASEARSAEAATKFESAADIFSAAVAKFMGGPRIDVKGAGLGG